MKEIKKFNKIDVNNIEKKLNIGLFLDTYYPMIDGVITVVDNYAKRLVKYANVTVFTIASKDKNYIDNFPYKIVRCNKLDIPGLDYDLAMPAFDAAFNQELKNSKLDIVHIHSPFSLGKAGVNYAKRHKIPLIATNHSQFKQDFFKATNSPALTDILLASVVSVLNKCDENWSVNEMTKELFYSYGLEKKPIVMPNGTDFKIEDYDKYDIDINKKYNLSKDDKLLLYVGRMIDLKNIPFLLDSFKLIHKKDSTFKLLLAGDGLRLDYYKDYVKKSNLQNYVIFAGKVTDRKLLGSLYKRANLFVFPSFYDTDGLVKKEAGCFKTPTLTIEKSFASSDIKDNVNGYISKNSIEDFCNKIIEIFADDKNYQEVCQNAQRDIYVNWDDIIQRVFERYKLLIKQKKTRNKAIKKSDEYTKTIKNIQKQHSKLKQEDFKSKQIVLRKMSKYPKTIHRIRKTKKDN